ncbi:MAG: hypothetical protein NC039_03235 [Muribaculaceae bacterium]|nr:hypothetical protein [Muribaculaceae bacterium]
MRALLILTMTLICALMATADDTRSRSLRPMPVASPEQAVTENGDTLRAPRCEAVTLAGYDKPLRASRETFLASNGLDVPITAIGIEIRYCDLDGRTLHERRVNCHAIIPAGGTRLISFRSWDANRSFFYCHGPSPRVSGVIPYDIVAKVVYVVSEPDLSND